MFSYEQRIKAIELYSKCESWTTTIRILGYPSVVALGQRVDEYTSNGDLRVKHTRKPKYSEEQIQTAIDYYLDHGKNIAKTTRDFKKDQGIILQALTSREKAIMIDTLREKYPLKEMLSVFHIAIKSIEISMPTIQPKNC